MEHIIQKAIEGGWNPEKHREVIVLNLNDRTGARNTTKTVRSSYTHLEIFLDPLFWQALGKALGLEKGIDTYPYINTAWRELWHRFIDHLAEGKTPESFFETLSMVG